MSGLATTLSGMLVGIVLGLVGGGGSILAVPLLVYVVGIGSTHLALGTSAIAVSLTALANLVPHWRAGNVRWPCAITFSLAGVIGAFAGSSVAKAMNGDDLLLLFGLLMLVVGLAMIFNRNGDAEIDVRMTRANASTLLPKLIPAGFAVGALSGFFGIGGGFLIVPGLILATRMPLANAIGTSLVAVAAFGATTAFNYALSGWVDWQIAALFIAGGALGGVIGVAIGKLMGRSKNALRLTFAAVVLIVGAWIIYKGLLAQHLI